MSLHPVVFPLLLVLVPLAFASRAQTVEYTIPTDYELVAGRLSVTFSDTLTEASARQVIETMGYAVADDAHFTPVTAFGVLDDTLQEAQRTALEAVPGFLALDLLDAREPLEEPLPQAVGHRYVLTIRMAPALTAEESRRRLASIPGLDIAGIEKRSNDLIILVPADKEEEAVDRLSEHPWIRYVAFLVAD